MADLPEQTKTLVDTLLTQTEEGRRAWEEGSARTEFALVQTAGSVVILSVDGGGEAPFELRVLDPAGHLVEKHDTDDAGSEKLEALYSAARDSSARASAVVGNLLHELNPPVADELDAELQRLITETVDTSGNTEFDALVVAVKPLMKLRFDYMRARGGDQMTWGEFAAPFPSGGGARHAIFTAIKELRDEGVLTYTMDPEPGPGQKTPGADRLIRFNFD